MKPPYIPLIEHELKNNLGHRDTLDRVSAVLHLLVTLDLSEGLSPKAQSGYYWIHLMLIDTVEYVSDALAHKTGDENA